MLHKKFICIIFSILLGISPVFSPLTSSATSSPCYFVFLDHSKATISIGQLYQILAYTAFHQKPTYTSSNGKVATVNVYGQVFGKKAGTTRITAKIPNAEASCTITVSKTAIYLSNTSLSLENGTEHKLYGSTSNRSIITWTSSKKSIATVSDTGLVCAQSPGTTTICASSEGTVKTCKVTVKRPTIKLSSSYIHLYRTQSYHLIVQTSSGLTPTYGSSKKSVALIDDSGNITAQKHGLSLIQVTLDGVSKLCRVEVMSPTIQLSHNFLSIKVGATKTLVARVSSNQTPTWTSSNDNVASVDSNGRIHGYKKGTAIIRASEDGTKETCLVTITK